jgi:hypothetical protein
MNRQDVTELRYITPIANVASILLHGLLSHHRAKTVSHRSVAMEQIQQKRRQKCVPGGRPLHDYVNLCFHARNPMLYKLRGEHETLCGLRVSAEVLDLPGVIITDGNAASKWTRFDPSPDGLERLSRDEVFAEWWTDPNPIEKWEKARKRCAEVLVPDRVDAAWIRGAYVSCESARQKLMAAGFRLPIAIDGPLFFR